MSIGPISEAILIWVGASTLHDQISMPVQHLCHNGWLNWRVIQGHLRAGKLLWYLTCLWPRESQYFAGKERTVWPDHQSVLWLKHYLNDRCVRARVDGTLPDRIDVLTGVSQNSVLGSCLFRIHTNGSPLLVRCQISLFVGNIEHLSWIIIIKDFCLLQRDLDAVSSAKSTIEFRECTKLK